MSIKDRIGRLEHTSGGRGVACPECRLKPEVIHVVFPDEGDRDPPSEWCPRCHSPLGFVIRVVYEGEGVSPIG
jgi:hypothetical protein